MEKSIEFWDYLDELIRSSPLIIDRPKGSAHPRFPEIIYPLDYGYLDRTTAVDGGGVDVWLGSAGGRELIGIICSVDLEKRDAEIKLLLGCTGEDVEVILRLINDASMRATYIPRPARPDLHENR